MYMRTEGAGKAAEVAGIASGVGTNRGARAAGSHQRCSASMHVSTQSSCAGPMV